MIDGLSTLEKSFEIKNAHLEVKDVTIQYLKHKVTRLEEGNKTLKEQIKDELSHHARYNALKTDVKDFVTEENRKKLMGKTRDRATKLLKGFLEEQETKYEELDKTEKDIETAHQKKVADMRKKQKADAAVAAVESKSTGGSKVTKSPIDKKKGGKATNKNDKPKRKPIAVPRARFISDITPQYNEEKKAAVAAGKKESFPALFTYVKKPWDEMDPAEKKRKYGDPFEAEKKQRAKEEAAAAAAAAGATGSAADTTVKKNKKTPVVAEQSDGEETDGGQPAAAAAAASDDDKANDTKTDGKNDENDENDENDDDGENDDNDDTDGKEGGDDDVVPSASEDEASDGHDSD
tara:strand:- start:152 stop:1198 length:1047 start_codon:yes stop_codon:yes gene_type:complete